MQQYDCLGIETLKLCLTIDQQLIYEFSEKINEASIIKTAKRIEQLLIDNKVSSGKIQNIFEVIVEVMQNILHYSYGNMLLENNKKEAIGFLYLSYQNQNNCYIVHSCNLVNQQQKDIIIKKITEIKGLDNKALRKLSRQKMRSKKDAHPDGAGLGFIMMAKKSIEPLDIDFVSIEEPIFQFKLKLVL